MNSDHSHKHALEPLMVELDTLMRNLAWDSTEGVYLEGEHLSLLLNPQPADHAEQVGLLLTLLPLDTPPPSPAGIAVLLGAIASSSSLCYGYLNHKGQVTFKELKRDVYRTAVTGPTSLTLFGLPELPTLPPLATLPLPDVPLRAGQAVSFRDASGLLRSTLYAPGSGGGMRLRFEVSDSAWHGKLLAFACTPPHQFLLTVLTWDGASQRCVAEVDLTVPSHPFDLVLPTAAWPTESLNPAWAEVLRSSVAQATEHTRQGWRWFLQSTPTLPPPLRTVLEHAVAEPSPSLWTHMEEAGAKIARLLDAIPIVLERATATFGSLPASLQPAWQPVAGGPLKRDPNAQHTEGLPYVALPSAEHGLSFQLRIDATANHKLTLTVQVSRHPSDEPLPRVRVTLRDQALRILEGSQTSSEGEVTFPQLTSGSYVLEIKSHDVLWQVPLSLVLEG